MYDLKALYEAQSVQDAVRLRLEHPQAQIIAIFQVFQCVFFIFHGF